MLLCFAAVKARGSHLRVHFKVYIFHYLSSFLVNLSLIKWMFNVDSKLRFHSPRTLARQLRRSSICTWDALLSIWRTLLNTRSACLSGVSRVELVVVHRYAVAVNCAIIMLVITRPNEYWCYEKRQKLMLCCSVG